MSVKQIFLSTEKHSDWGYRWKHLPVERKLFIYLETGLWPGAGSAPALAACAASPW